MVVREYQLIRFQTTTFTDIQHTICDFVSRSGYRWGSTPPDSNLRAAIMAEVLQWDSCGNTSIMERIVDSACALTESAYGHLSPTHRRYVALYTACLLYCDDLGGEQLEAVRQFAVRLARGQPQLTPALSVLADLLREAHELWSAVGADAIITGTVDALTATAIEFATTGTPVAPSALRYPYYLRTRAGGGPQYTHFMFMRSWREKADSYLQILP